MTPPLDQIVEAPAAAIAFGEAHGATIMLSLLASRWLISILAMIRAGDADGRSLPFDAIAFVAYAAGALHFSATHGPDWIGETAGLFFVANLLLIALDAALIVKFRSEARAFERRLHGSDRRRA